MFLAEFLADFLYSSFFSSEPFLGNEVFDFGFPVERTGFVFFINFEKSPCFLGGFPCGFFPLN
jgi:hypothetical protein